MPRRRSSRRNEGTFDYNFDEVVGQILLAKTVEALSGGGRVDGRGPSAWHHTPPRETSRLRVNGSSRTRRTPRRAVDHPGLAHRTGAALAQATPRGRNNLRASPSRIKRRQISRTTWPPHAATSSWTSRPSRRRSGPMRRSSRSPPPGTVRSSSPRPLTISPPIARRSVGRSIDRAFPAPRHD